MTVAQATLELVEGMSLGESTRGRVVGVLMDDTSSVPLGLTPETWSELVVDSLALMLYGSQARGSASSDSDVDVLKLAMSARSADPRPGRVSVTVYKPSQLHALARKGSLFVLHLRTEGKILYDPQGVLQHALDSYKAPASYREHLHDYAALNRATAVAESLFRERGQDLSRLGIYILRSLVYTLLADSGTLTFDIGEGLRLLRRPDLDPVINLRKKRDPYTQQDLHSLHEAVVSLLPEGMTAAGPALASEADLVSLAVRLGGERPDAAQLLAVALSEPGSLDYANLALP